MDQAVPDGSVSASRRYVLTLNGREGSVTVGPVIRCEFDGRSYPVDRTQSKSSWGYTDYNYALRKPDGGFAFGGASPRDGVGVSLPDGHSWSLSRRDDHTHELGANTLVRLDQAALRIAVESTEPDDTIPYILCGVVLLIDDNAQ
jgi:hypothetical protein